MNLFDVCEQCNGQVKKMALAFDTQQKAIHTFLKLASLTEDFLRITFSRLRQLVSRHQKLLRVSDCILTAENIIRNYTWQIGKV